MYLMRNLNRLFPSVPEKLMKSNIGTFSTLKNEDLVIDSLKEREVIRIKGDEVVQFLQGLVTNDVKHLHTFSNKAIYAMFLNRGGRIMYDSILYSTSDPTEILIECDKNVTSDLIRHLKLYRVRRKIDIDTGDQEFKVWQAFSPTNKDCLESVVNIDKTSKIIFSSDPRLKHLGIRILTSKSKEFSDLSKIFKQPVSSAKNDNNFRLHRYNLGIAEGVVDIPPGKCFPLEANCDFLNGVSFHKGCYIGQELTARVHHTGVIRKRHMPVKLDSPLPENASLTVQNEIGANCGTILGSTGNKALGLLRVNNVKKSKELFVNGSACFAEKPTWWPQELHMSVSTRRSN